ncbi:MAG: AlkZ family DNA glycosylase [Armatimonadetes bacterium]|nr:AlkZ family DNA glycosylase [Anaerolineae bacterium]
MIPLLTRRALNRALLARQLLLVRAPLTPLQAVAQLAALQAQLPNPPYIGLWTRLAQFERDDLTQLMQQRQVVRAAWLRSTLHLITADDHQRFRQTLQPALARGLSSFFGKRIQGLESAALIAAAADYCAQQPRTMGEIRARLLEIEPERDGDALAYVVRTYLPLVQAPPGGVWGSGSGGGYVTAASWLSAPAQPDDLQALFRRYLAAFGPAGVMDFQTWTGMTKLKPALEPLLPTLRVYQDERGTLLYDLPDQALPDLDTPAPIRLIPEYDNILIAHADRTRILADADRQKVFLSSARVLSTFTVDGFVAGTWKIERAKRTAALVIAPFAPLDGATTDSLVAEAERLLRWVDPQAETVAVRL